MVSPVKQADAGQSDLTNPSCGWSARPNGDRGAPAVRRWSAPLPWGRSHRLLQAVSNTGCCSGQPQQRRPGDTECRTPPPRPWLTVAGRWTPAAIRRRWSHWRQHDRQQWRGTRTKRPQAASRTAEEADRNAWPCTANGRSGVAQLAYRDPVHTSCYPFAPPWTCQPSPWMLMRQHHHVRQHRQLPAPSTAAASVRTAPVPAAGKVG